MIETLYFLKLAANSDRQDKPAEAARWCSEYNLDGNQAGQGFLNQITELEEAFAHEDKINSALRALGLPRLSLILWSSSEFSPSPVCRAWHRFHDNESWEWMFYKHYALCVRCAFPLFT